MATQPDTFKSAPRARPGRLLGDVIVDLGFCDRATVERIVVAARESGRPMGQLLLEQHALRSHQLGIAIAERFGLKFIDLKAADPDLDALALLPESDMRRLDAVPIAFGEDGSLIVAMEDPRNLMATDDIAMLTNRGVVPVVVTREDLDALLARLGGLQAGSGELPAASRSATVDRRAAGSRDDAAVKLVGAIVASAIAHDASDIHLDPAGGELLVRHRIDGVMREVDRVAADQARGLVSRIKILCELDVAEHRAPQEGHMSLTLNARQVDVHATILPLVDAESVVLRVLGHAAAPRPLGELGLGDDERGALELALKRGRGAILAAGPIGSGTSATLYAALAFAGTPEKTIMTVEDPVEYRLPGVQQVQVVERGGVGLASGLRAILRSDPNIVMVGELPDRDTAQTLVDAALTGHLMLSSVHAASAAAAVARLVDMGIEPYLVASALECVVGQRLVRRLCTDCRRAVVVPGADVGVEDDEATIFEPAGCERCGDSGYRGRTAVFEVMTVSEEIRSLVVARAASSEILAVAVRQGMRTLREAGLAKVRAGETSRIELARVVG